MLCLKIHLNLIYETQGYKYVLLSIHKNSSAQKGYKYFILIASDPDLDLVPNVQIRMRPDPDLQHCLSIAPRDRTISYLSHELSVGSP
jgi:hypothetical protein